jgi:hypothetical protein
MLICSAFAGALDDLIHRVCCVYVHTCEWGSTAPFVHSSNGVTRHSPAHKKRGAACSAAMVMCTYILPHSVHKFVSLQHDELLGTCTRHGGGGTNKDHKTGTREGELRNATKRFFRRCGGRGEKLGEEERVVESGGARAGAHTKHARTLSPTKKSLALL